MHIKNPCKMHYQIQNFNMEKANKTNHNSVCTSNSVLRTTNFNMDSAVMNIDVSDKSSYFYQNPLLIS